MVLAMLLLGTINTVWATGEHWTWNPHEYASNSTFVGIITIEGVEQRSAQLEIGAFYDGVCRGSIKCLYVESRDRYYAFLTVNGEAGMTMTFRLWNHATDTELEVTSESTYTFYPDDFFGLPSNPYVFPFSLDFEGPVYTGEEDMQWSNIENWRNELFPSEGDEVFILSNCIVDTDAAVSDMTIIEGQTLTVQSGNTLNVSGDLTNTMASGLVIEDGAQLVNASDNVAATVLKDITAYGYDNPDGWYTIASPVDRMPIEGSDFLTPEFDLYRYDETSLTQEEWQNYKADNPGFTFFENGRGYLYANSNTFSPAFTGTLNNAAVGYRLTYTERPDELSGLNLIGNPFPHVIYKGEGGAIDNANLASGYYTLTNEGAWHVHTYDDAIQPGQGILVRTTAATELTIAKSNAVASSESPGAKSGMGRLMLKVSGDRGEDRAFAYFGQGIGLNKLDNFSDQLPNLWISDEGVSYAIAHVGDGCEPLEVCFSSGQSGDFTLSVDVSDTDFSALRLIDRVAGITVDMLQQPTYTFHAEGTENEARFRLMFEVETGLVETPSEAFCFVRDKVICFDAEAEGGHLTMTDVLGREVKSVMLKGNTIAVSELPNGIYIIRLTKGNEVKTQKVVLR